MLKPLMVASLVVGLVAATTDALPRTQKSSTSQRFDPATEVKAYYAALLSENATVKQQFDSLAKQSALYGDVHFGPGEPQVVTWYPVTNQFTAGANFHYDERFLVVHPLTFGRPTWHESDAAVISEFRVIHKGKTRVDNNDPEKNPQLVTNTITIEFLGFRRFQLAPIP